MMAHQVQPTALDTITELLSEHGFGGLAFAVTVLLNEVMRLERSAALGVMRESQGSGSRSLGILSTPAQASGVISFGYASKYDNYFGKRHASGGLGRGRIVGSQEG